MGQIVFEENGPINDPRRIDFSESEIIRLAEIGATQEECADYLGVGIATFKRRMKEAKYRAMWERGRASGKVKLRLLQWRHARGTGSAAVQMTIHLSKQLLGDTDRVVMTGPDGQAIQVSHKHVHAIVELPSNGREIPIDVKPVEETTDGAD